MSDEKITEEMLVPPDPDSDVEMLTRFQEELVVGLHLIKYNMYLLAKSNIFTTLFNSRVDGKDLSLSDAVNLTHAVLGAFHKQDHPEPIKEPNKETTEESN